VILSVAKTDLLYDAVSLDCFEAISEHLNYMDHDEFFVFLDISDVLVTEPPYIKTVRVLARLSLASYSSACYRLIYR